MDDRQVMLPTTQTTTTMQSSSASSKAPAMDAALLELQKGKNKQQTTGRGNRRVVLAAAVGDVCLAAASLAGASLLTWWALVFHPSCAQLWMVPVGLVLACTPVVVCAALHFSPAADDTLPPPLSAVVVVDFEDMSCEMIYGQVPPPIEDDPVSKQPCYPNLSECA